MHRSCARLLIAALLILVLPGASSSQDEASSTHAQMTDGILILNEISPWPADGEVWVEFIDPTDQPVALSGWSIEFISGFSYTFSPNSGEVAGGGLHILNITGGNPLNPEGDGCILTGPDGPVDAITWGGASADVEMPIPAGPPLMPPFRIIRADETIHRPDDVCVRLPDTWSPDIDDWVGSEHWVYRHGNAASRGEPNPAPPPLRFSPEDGAILASDFTLYVTGCEWTEETTFQIATDEGFQDIVLEETVGGYSLFLEDFPPGTYYWRVRGYTDDPAIPGPWSEHRELTREPFDIDELIEAAEAEEQTGSTQPSSGDRLAQHKGGNHQWRIMTKHLIPGPHLYQGKDTGMVCLDGCPMNGACRWCAGHGLTENCKHGDGYCTRASLAMAAAAGGCSLSQDRITYYIFEEAGTASRAAVDSGHIGNPRRDLGHDVGTEYDEDCRLALAWIYNQPVSAVRHVSYHSQIFDDHDPSDMDSIREFIRDNRPVLRHSDDHTTLITGCAVLIDGLGTELPRIQVKDPGSPNDTSWVSLASQPSEFKDFTFPPTTGRPVRNDELEMYLDADSDGLLDFDETRRFHTDPNNPDSDMDGVHDRQDIQGYVFRSNGNYHWRNPDVDGDGAWKELDPDNDWADDKGMMDGCEDPNLNGFFDQGWDETNCFAAGDDFAVFHPECQRGWIRNEYYGDITALYGPVMTGYVNWWEVISIEDEPIDSDEYVHTHVWGYELGLYQEGAYVESSEGGRGMAKARLERDPATGEYFVHTDTRPSENEFEITTVIPTINLVTQMMIPSFFYFAVATPHPLGTPERNEEGALVLKGEWEVFEGTGALPHCSQLISWEIWIEPPGSGP